MATSLSASLTSAPPSSVSEQPTPNDVVVAQLRMPLVDRQALPGEAAVIPAPLTPVLTLELDGAALTLGVTGDELLLAAFGRAVARTIGEGVVAVDVLRGTVAASVDLCCAGERQMDATEVVRLAHRALLSSDGFGTDVAAESLFNYLGTTRARSGEPPLRGYALELRAYRDQDLMWLDWWFDTARFDAVTVRELSEQFPFALIELTSEALPVE